MALSTTTDLSLVRSIGCIRSLSFGSIWSLQLRVDNLGFHFQWDSFSGPIEYTECSANSWSRRKCWDWAELNGGEKKQISVEKLLDKCSLRRSRRCERGQRTTRRHRWSRHRPKRCRRWRPSRSPAQSRSSPRSRNRTSCRLTHLTRSWSWWPRCKTVAAAVGAIRRHCRCCRRRRACSSWRRPTTNRRHPTSRCWHLVQSEKGRLQTGPGISGLLTSKLSRIHEFFFLTLLST